MHADKCTKELKPLNPSYWNWVFPHGAKAMHVSVRCYANKSFTLGKLTTAEDLLHVIKSWSIANKPNPFGKVIDSLQVEGGNATGATIEEGALVDKKR